MLATTGTVGLVEETFRRNSSTPGFGNPSEFTSVLSFTFLTTLGFALPGQGCRVIVPATRYPKPSLERVRRCMPVLSKPPASPRGLTSSPIEVLMPRLTPEGFASGNQPISFRPRAWALSASSRSRSGLARVERSDLVTARAPTQSRYHFYEVRDGRSLLTGQ